MFFAGVKVEIWFGICDEVTLGTLVCHTEVLGFHMLPQQTLSCRLVATLVTGIFYLHVNSIFMNFYTALLCSLVRALITGPPLFLME